MDETRNAMEGHTKWDPLYKSHEWERYASETGIKVDKCALEHKQANGMVKRFMGSQV